MGGANLRKRELVDYGDELRASLAAGRELGLEMSDEVAVRFLRDVEQAIDAKIEARFANHERSRRWGRFVQAGVVVGSTTAMVPLTAVAINAGGFEGFLGAFVAWLTIVLLDLVITLKS